MFIYFIIQIWVVRPFINCLFEYWHFKAITDNLRRIGVQEKVDYICKSSYIYIYNILANINSRLYSMAILILQITYGTYNFDDNFVSFLQSLTKIGMIIFLFCRKSTFRGQANFFFKKNSKVRWKHDKNFNPCGWNLVHNEYTLARCG